VGNSKTGGNRETGRKSGIKEEMHRHRCVNVHTLGGKSTYL